MSDETKDQQNAPQAGDENTVEPDDVPQAGPEDSPPVGGREGEGGGIDEIEEAQKRDS